MSISTSTDKSYTCARTTLALTWLMSFKNLQGQTARWIQHMQEYNFTSEHRQGRKHNNAEALSRRSCQEECTHCHKVEAPADVKQVRAIATVAAAGRDPATLRTKRPRHRAHPTGSTNRAATGEERHCRPQPHVQNLLGSVEIARCEKIHFRAQLGIRQRTISNSPNSSPSVQNKRCADLTTRWMVRRSLRCQQNPE
jgi:hypothetical protein